MKCAPMNKNKELMANMAYEELKWQILNGEIELGQLYTEQSICELINVGRSPVRSALSRLQHDRLIEIIPRKGMLVRGISSQEIKEILQVRLCLEQLVAKLAIKYATDEDIATMESLLDQTEKNDLSDRKMAMRIDHEFHIALANSTGNTVLTEVVSFIKNRSSILWFRNIVTTDKMKQVQIEHKKILSAIKNRDEKAAVKVLGDHITQLENINI